MQKKESNTFLAENKKSFIAAVLGSVGGTGMICISNFLFALLVHGSIFPFKHVGLMAGIAMMLGGMVCGILIGNRGRMLLYVPIAFGMIMGLLFLLGKMLFDGFFQPETDPLILSSLLLGLLLGSGAVNLR